MSVDKKTKSRETRPSALTRVRRLPELGLYDHDAICQVLDAATHCHIGHLIGTQPVVTPTLHWRLGDRVYWHGSVASRMLKATSAQASVCLTATVIDGWVLARSAFNHTANYRSAMCFGTPELVDAPAEKARLLEALTDRLFPGRWALLRPMTRKELGATTILSLQLTETSAKVRVGPPEDPARDREWPVWAGVIPLRQAAGRPIADSGVSPRLKAPRVSVARRPKT